MGQTLRLSIIICAHNEFANLKRWRTKIHLCSDPRIEFIIKDSGKCSETRALFANDKSKKLTFICEKDAGLYNALNIAIKSSSEFYLVAGADDEINIDNLSFALDQVAPGADLIFGAVSKGCKQVRSKDIRIPMHTLTGVISSHSVGVIIRAKLHERYGQYNEELKILSDIEFLLPLLKERAIKKQFVPIVFGNFSMNGVSSEISKIRVLEAFIVFWKLKHYRLLQPIFFSLRLLKLMYVRR